MSQRYFADLRVGKTSGPRPACFTHLSLVTPKTASVSTPSTTTLATMLNFIGNLVCKG